MMTLRDMAKKDRDMIRKWRNSPEVSRYMYTDHIISEAEHRKWFKATLANPSAIYWVCELDGRPVGLTGLYLKDERTAGWAFYVADPDCRGKGVGSFMEWATLNRAFGPLKLEKLWDEVLASNDAVVQMHERFGWRREGYLRKHVRKGDVVRIGILASEWADMKDAVKMRLTRKGIIA